MSYVTERHPRSIVNFDGFTVDAWPVWITDEETDSCVFESPVTEEDEQRGIFVLYAICFDFSEAIEIISALEGTPVDVDSIEDERSEGMSENDPYYPEGEERDMDYWGKKDYDLEDDHIASGKFWKDYD